MAINYTLPSPQMPVVNKEGKATLSWWKFFSSIVPAAEGRPEIVLTVGSSPFSYTCPDDGFVLVQGGTVSAITITRSTTHSTGLTSGMLPVGRGDVLEITYSSIPNMVMFPL